MLSDSILQFLDALNVSRRILDGGVTYIHATRPQVGQDRPRRVSRLARPSRLVDRALVNGSFKGQAVHFSRPVGAIDGDSDLDAQFSESPCHFREPFRQLQSGKSLLDLSLRQPCQLQGSFQFVPQHCGSPPTMFLSRCNLTVSIPDSNLLSSIQLSSLPTLCHTTLHRQWQALMEIFFWSPVKPKVDT